MTICITDNARARWYSDCVGHGVCTGWKVDNFSGVLCENTVDICSIVIDPVSEDGKIGHRLHIYELIGGEVAVGWRCHGEEVTVNKQA
jgi:hypothetical protein